MSAPAHSSTSTTTSNDPLIVPNTLPPPEQVIGLDSPHSAVDSMDSATQSAGASKSDLTPQRAHYLKKYLIQLQFRHELDAITSPTHNNISTLSFLGPPFAPPPKNATFLDLPFLRYIFRQYVLTFPFMAAAPKDFYSDKLQPFLTAALARNLSPTSVLDDGPDSSERATRMKILVKLERNLALFIGAATKLVEREEVVRLHQTDLDRLETLAQKRLARLAKQQDSFEVNIVSVRTVIDKGRMRSRVHEEFIIRTRRSRYSDVYVSRRYGDFRTLVNELRRAHPDEVVPPPPAKDRRVVNVPPSASPMSQASFASPQQAYMDGLGVTPSTSSLPGSPQPTTPSRLSREKNRLTLRAYLHSLLSSATIASSPVLRSFLSSGPTTLTAEELEDAQKREEADGMREAGYKRFAKEIAGRVDSLREAVKSVKGDMMGKDGLTHIFATVKVTPDIRQLPHEYQAVVEWARITLASKIFQLYVASDNSSESFASLKRIHGLMPYFMLKAALKITNPIAMIRSVLDLFLAQPFGGRSLLQRMFTSSLTEEVKVLEEQIENVKDKVADPIFCLKIKQFVYAAREIQDLYKADAAEEQMNLLTIVLRSADEPVLSRAQMHRLAKAQRAHAVYMRTREALEDSDDDDGPQDEDAWLLEDLRVLTLLYSRLRDREQLIALIFEGFTADLLKDIITIFYSPLAQVYRAASIADSISDLQSFINDLIRTVEQVEELSTEDPHRTVQAFIDLVQRHEQAFYSFVHKVHSKGAGLFDGLMRWIESFLTSVREGLGSPISLEFLLPHTGKERADILAEVDKIALHHYKLKVLYENKLRRRFGRARGQSEADAEEEATQVLLNGVIGEISFGELIQGDADDVAAEETDEDSDQTSSDYETGSEDDDESTSSGDNDSSSEESLPEQRLKRPPLTAPASPRILPTTRSATVDLRTRPSPSMDLQRPPAPRQRTLSLKRVRSMTLPFGGQGESARRNKDQPPVPPLPPMPQTANVMSKPLPPTPTPPKMTPRVQIPNGNHATAVPIIAKPKKKSNPKDALKPPDVQLLPQLLPVFTEMMRPLLRPRATNNSVST